MKKITILTISMISVVFMVACGGGSGSSDSTPDPIPKNGEPCPNPEAHVYYNTYAPIANDYEITGLDDLKKRLNFFDSYSAVVGTNSPSTISNLINNSSVLSSFYSTWNSVIGSTTVSQYNTMKTFYDTYYTTVSPYNLGQIQQYINGALYVAGKKLFINDVLHQSQTGQSWNKSTTKLMYGFTTGKATDIQICIVNKANYNIVDSSVITRYTDGFSINITTIPAGSYIVTVSGNYTVPGVSYQDTEVGAFMFTR